MKETANRKTRLLCFGTTTRAEPPRLLRYLLRSTPPSGTKFRFIVNRKSRQLPVKKMDPEFIWSTTTTGFWALPPGCRLLLLASCCFLLKKIN